MKVGTMEIYLVSVDDQENMHYTCKLRKSSLFISVISVSNYKYYWRSGVVASGTDSHRNIIIRTMAKLKQLMAEIASPDLVCS